MPLVLVEDRTVIADGVATTTIMGIPRKGTLVACGANFDEFSGGPVFCVIALRTSAGDTILSPRGVLRSSTNAQFFDVVMWHGRIELSGERLTLRFPFVNHSGVTWRIRTWYLVEP